MVGLEAVTAVGRAAEGKVPATARQGTAKELAKQQQQQSEDKSAAGQSSSSSWIPLRSIPPSPRLRFRRGGQSFFHRSLLASGAVGRSTLLLLHALYWCCALRGGDPSVRGPVSSSAVKMSDNLMDKVNALGERLKITGTEVSKKMAAGMSSMSFKMKELFQGQTPSDKIVEDTTSENLDGPDWNSNLEICDLMNTEKVNSVELIRAIKKRIMLKDARIQYLALVLLEMIAKNCEKAFSEVAAERVLDEMVRLIDDPQTVVNNRNKALMMIEAWGEAGDELRYLPVYEETYKSLKSRGVRFPGRDNESLAPIFTPPRSVAEAEGAASLPHQAFEDVLVHTYTAEETKEAFDVARNSIELLSTVLSSSPEQDALQDDLTATLVQQCYQSQHTIQRIIETIGDNEAVLFEALSVNDEIQKVLSKYEEMNKPRASENAEQRPVVIPIATEHEDSTAVGNEDALVRKPAAARTRSGGDDDILDDLDEMIFGKKGGSSSQDGPKKQDPKKDDLISF